MVERVARGRWPGFFRLWDETLDRSEALLEGRDLLIRQAGEWVDLVRPVVFEEALTELRDQAARDPDPMTLGMREAVALLESLGAPW